MLDLSIIVVNFNTRELTIKCLESVFKYTKGVEFEVILVDNASDDRSVTEIRRKFRNKVFVIKNKENVGFGAANNQGMVIAQGKYFCLLNSDTLLIGNVFEKMIQWFDQNTYLPVRNSFQFRRRNASPSSIPSHIVKRYPIGVMGCKLLNPDRTEQYSLGKFPTLSEVFKRLFLDRFTRKVMPSKSVQSEYVMGAFMLLKREVFERTEGFDEKIFMYAEELEWCYRIYQHDFSIVYWPDAAIIHYGGGSAVRGRIDRIVHNFQGLLYFYKKHYSTSVGMLKFLLKSKAYLCIVIGKLMKNRVLVKTYREALEVIR